MSKEEDRRQLKSLSNGKCYIGWSEGGGAEVIINPTSYLLYEIPQYGGEPQFTKEFLHEEIEELLNVVYSWS